MFGIGTASRPQVVAFDVIGTLFPLEPLRTRLVSLGLAHGGLEAWFATGLRDAFALAATGQFKPFTEVLGSALDTVLAQQGAAPPDAERKALLKEMEHLPARPDARAAFEVLREADVPVLAVSNGAKAATVALLKGAGLHELVAHVVSVEQVKRSKPFKKVYLKAAKVGGVAPAGLALVAAHPWDINGAHAAGLVTGLVGPLGLPYPKVMHAPDVEAESLVGVVEALLALKPA